jgi:preprotein translocase subunit SecE
MAVNKDDAVNNNEAQVVEPSATNTPGLWARFKRFLREVKFELKKTSWPSRDELTKSTVVVVATIVVVALLLSVYDTMAYQLMKFLKIVH